MPGDAKPISLIEDCAVAVDKLGDFVTDIEEMLASYGKESVYHAHIGTGELHIRPLINLKDPRMMQSCCAQSGKRPPRLSRSTADR